LIRERRQRSDERDIIIFFENWTRIIGEEETMRENETTRGAK
jgi:hypothetical protein